MTPRQAYTVENHSAVFGSFLFENGPFMSDTEIAQAAGPVTVFSSRKHSRTYPNLAEAKADRIARRAGMSMRAPDAEGLVFDAAGNLVFRFTAGLVRPVKYIGHWNDTEVAKSPCTRVMLGL